MPVSYETYKRLALEDPEGSWELVCWRPREKPPMTMEHNRATRELHYQLVIQLDHSRFTVSSDQSRVRIRPGNDYIPDLFVIPREYERRLGQQPGTFEVYTDPIPLVVEVWSPSTGTYDVESKLREYQERGDAEIWRIHPYERTLTAWIRQPDGTYSESLHSGGEIKPAALPGVTINIPALFTER